MTALLVALVTLLGVAVTIAAAVAAVHERRRARTLAVRRRIQLGRRYDSGEEPSPFLGQDLTILARRRGPIVVNPLGVAEVGGAALGVVLGLTTLDWPLGLLGVALGFVPMAIGWRSRLRAGAHMVRLLPNLLDVTASALRAGHGLAEALRLGAAETEEPLRSEITRVVDEHDLGIPLREALLGLLDRHGRIVELRLFVTSVLFQMQAGGNLIELLEQVSGSIRDRIVFEDKARAITAEVRLSTTLLSALPFAYALVMWILVPEHFQPMLASSVGRAMLIGAGVAVAVGYGLVHGLARTLEP